MTFFLFSLCSGLIVIIKLRIGGACENFYIPLNPLQKTEKIGKGTWPRLSRNGNGVVHSKWCACELNITIRWVFGFTVSWMNVSYFFDIRQKLNRKEGEFWVNRAKLYMPSAMTTIIFAKLSFILYQLSLRYFFGGNYWIAFSHGKIFVYI